MNRLADQNTKLKSLYDEGLISRHDFEASGDSLSQSRQKLENARKQIASADTLLSAALKQDATTNLEASARRVPRLWSTGNSNTDNLIKVYSGKYRVDPYLVYVVMRQDSAFNRSAKSWRGAQGLMQLMPATAARYGISNPYDPEQNIMAGTRYLKDLLLLFNGRVDLALAGYNAGEGAVMKYGNQVPPFTETKDYVKRLSASYSLNAAAQEKARTGSKRKKKPTKSSAQPRPSVQ